MDLLFYIAATVSVVATIRVITHFHAVHALLYLIVMLLSLAIIFFLLGAPFAAALEIIIYAGAIMVLFVFVIMLLNAGTEERTSGSRVAMIFGMPAMLVGSALVAWVLVQRSGTQSVAVGSLPGDPKTIAWLLFHEFLLPFEVTSVLVLIAIMGAVVLASRPESVQQAKREG
jgi:NADH-quinone oxidoreductase subunit J